LVVTFGGVVKIPEKICPLKTVNMDGKNIILKYSKIFIYNTGVSKMGYLICQECGGYYKLEKGESKEDFVSCECYGSLTYIDDIDGYLKENNGPDKDISLNVNDKFIETELDDFEHGFNNEENDGFEDEASRNDFEDETYQLKQKSESISFPSFKGSDSQGVKNRNYYRKINSKDKKPDIGKLKLIKDVNGIIDALSYDDPGVKLEAVKALRSIGDERALEPLDKVKTEEKGILKTYAENAIFHIESKKRGLKSQNRAYYREEYNKEVSTENDEKLPINQSIHKDGKTLKISKKSKNVFKENQPTSVRDMGAVPFDKVPIEKNSDNLTVSNPSQFESKSNPVNNGYSKDNHDRNVLSDNTKAVNEKNGISNVIDVPGVSAGSSASKPKTRNLFSRPFSKPKTIPEPGNTSKPGISEKSAGKTGQSKKSITRPSSARSSSARSNSVNSNSVRSSTGRSNTSDTLVNNNLKNPNPMDSNSPKYNSSLLTSSAPERSITRDSTPKSGIKDARENDVIDGDYFIQFLGIKNADKPLIGFIFLFAASLILGVLLTMGYN